MHSGAWDIYVVLYCADCRRFLFSFTDWNMDRMNEPKFAGLRNFINLFGDDVFLRSAGNTALFAVMTTVLKLAVGLALALLVVQKFKGNGVFPYTFLSAMCVKLYDYRAFVYRDIENGRAFKQCAQGSWDGSNGMRLVGQIRNCHVLDYFIEVWMWAGFNMFLFISGLQSIPAELYESAQMDGASAWERFVKITLPMLAPSFTVVTTLNITGGLKVFDLVYALTGGGPGFDTQVLSTYAYRAFGLGLLGKSSASSMILSVGVVAITFAMNRFLRSKEVEA